MEDIEWFPSNESMMGEVAMAVIVYTDSLPIFVVFYIDCGESMEVVKPKLTANACEKMAISATFPREALCSLFMELMWLVTARL